MHDFPFGVLFGGIGLFLLGMTLMTEGLKSASGPMLVKFLEKTTNTRIKGFFSGFLATTILQSSTATTLLTIGFVNAGILSFAGSLWLLFGANVGTTMTGWLVALVGLKIKVEIFALPMIGLGVAMQMMSKKSIGAFGGILAGFGILFLGLGFLQESFANAATIFDFSKLLGHGILSTFAFLFAGFVLTVVMQSSTAATAVILTLAYTVNLPITESAASVIGANIGTTVTAIFATIGATANAKRAASAHILFNVIAGVVAFAILPFFVRFLDWAVHLSHIDDSVATQLALFHTTFNLLGVLLMIPLAGLMANFLSKCFTGSDILIEKPKYLDATLLDIPPLAIEALMKELDRYRDLLVTSLRGFLSVLHGQSSVLPKVNKLHNLSEMITDFVVKMSKGSMSEGIAEDMARCLQLRDQYSKSTSYLDAIVREYKEPKKYGEPMDKQLAHYLDTCDELLAYIDTPIGAKPRALSERKLSEFDEVYEKFKKFLLKTAVVGTVSVRDMEQMMTLVRTLRRMVYAFAKAQKVTYYQEENV